MGNDSLLEKAVLDCHSVRITDYAFDKMNAYSRIVSSIIGRPSEIMGLLVGEKDDLGCTATDAFILRDQNVYAAKAKPESNSFAKAYAEVKKEGKVIVGMWHSHGSISNFHSPDDDNHLIDVLINNSYFLKCRLGIGEIVVPYASSIVINQDSYLRSSPSEGPEEGRHYFCCVAFRDEQGDKRLVEGLEIDLVMSDEFLLDESGLVDDVCNYVRHNGEYLKDVVEPVDYEDEQWNDEGWGFLDDLLSGFALISHLALGSRSKR